MIKCSHLYGEIRLLLMTVDNNSIPFTRITYPIKTAKVLERQTLIREAGMEPS